MSKSPFLCITDATHIPAARCVALFGGWWQQYAKKHRLFSVKPGTGLCALIFRIALFIFFKTGPVL